MILKHVMLITYCTGCVTTARQIVDKDVNAFS